MGSLALVNANQTENSSDKVIQYLHQSEIMQEILISWSKLPPVSYEKIFTINELSKNLINDLKNKKKDIIKSRELVETIGSKILRKTTKQINNFLNYENH